MPARWSRRSSSGIGPGSRGGICPRCSAPGRRCGPGITGWPRRARGIACWRRSRPQRTRPGWSTRHCRRTRRSPVRISTRRTPPASQGAGSSYKNLQEEPPDHGIGRSRGGLSTKIHQLVDGNGLPLVTLITPGQAGDSPMFLPLMQQWRAGRDHGRPRTRPDAVRADKAYSSRAIRGHLRSRGIKTVIPEPDDQKGHRKRRGARGGRPVGLDALDDKNRNVIERQYCHLKQWRSIATRYDKPATVYRAAVLLNAVLAWTKTLSDTPSRCRTTAGRHASPAIRPASVARAGQVRPRAIATPGSRAVRTRRVQR